MGTKVTAASHALNRRSRLIASAAVLGLAAVWGATFFMVKDATRDFPVLAFLALRFALAAIAMLPLAIRLGRWPHRAEARWGIVAGLLLCAGYVFQTFSLRLIDSGRTGFITGLYVVMVPFLALLLLRHRLTRRVVIGTFCALIGLVLLSYAPGGSFMGDGLAFLCALSYALQILAVEKFPRDADWRLMSALQTGTVAVVCAALMPLLALTRGCDAALCVAAQPFADPLPTLLPLFVLTTALFTGFVASGLGLSIQTWAQKILPPSDTALIFAMEAPFSALFGALFKGEILTVAALAGGGLILAGMLITSSVQGKQTESDPLTEVATGVVPSETA